MAICLPGMPSNVKRAATSQMRVAPLVMTTNWMTMRMTKMMMPDDEVAAGHEVAEGLDDVAGGGGGLLGVVGVRRGQDQPRGGDVQHQAEERRAQQQRREDGELQRAFDVDGGQQDQRRHGQVGGDEHVHDHRRHGHDDDRDHGNHGDGDKESLIPGYPAYPEGNGKSGSVLSHPWPLQVAGEADALEGVIHDAGDKITALDAFCIGTWAPPEGEIAEAGDWRLEAGGWRTGLGPGPGRI